MSGTSSDGSSTLAGAVGVVDSDAQRHPLGALLVGASPSRSFSRSGSQFAMPGALMLVVDQAAGVEHSSTSRARRRARRGRPTPGCPRRCSPISTSSGTTSVIDIAAAALLLIGFSQTAGDARRSRRATATGSTSIRSQVAQGMANVGAGVFQGMPVSTTSASSLNESAGGSNAGGFARDRRARARDADRAGTAVLAVRRRRSWPRSSSTRWCSG